MHVRPRTSYVRVPRRWGSPSVAAGWRRMLWVLECEEGSSRSGLCWSTSQRQEDPPEEPTQHPRVEIQRRRTNSRALVSLYLPISFRHPRLGGSHRSRHRSASVNAGRKTSCDNKNDKRPQHRQWQHRRDDSDNHRTAGVPKIVFCLVEEEPNDCRLRNSTPVEQRLA